MLLRVKTRVAEFFKPAYYILLILPAFFSAAFSKRGLGSADGRILIWGKLRRILISLVPHLSKFLQEHYALSGGCTHCSSSCKLLFQCPHWDDKNSRCGIYEYRPTVCRQFPVTPSDIRDRNLVSRDIPCGFRFNHNVGARPSKTFIPKGLFPKIPR